MSENTLLFIVYTVFQVLTILLLLIILKYDKYLRFTDSSFIFLKRRRQKNRIQIRRKVFPILVVLDILDIISLIIYYVLYFKYFPSFSSSLQITINKIFRNTSSCLFSISFLYNLF